MRIRILFCSFLLVIAALAAFPAADQIFGYEWPEGSEVSLNINGEYIATANVQGAPGDQLDLLPGHYLFVSDGSAVKELELEALTSDLFDPESGLAQGTAPPPPFRHVWVGIGWEEYGWSLDVDTDAAGSWTADFGQPVPEGFAWVAAQVFDIDGDASEVRPSP